MKQLNAGVTPQMQAESERVAELERRLAEVGHTITDKFPPWVDFAMTAPQDTWVPVRSEDGRAIAYEVPPLRPARPGCRWELQIEGFLRMHVNKACTIYISANTTLETRVSGGAVPTGAGDVLAPLQQRIPIVGKETVTLMLIALAFDGADLTISSNPTPNILIREVMA